PGPYTFPKIEPRLQRISPNNHARVGEVNDAIDPRIVIGPVRAAFAVRISSLRKVNPVGAHQRRHVLIRPGHLFRYERRWKIEREWNLHPVLSTHHLPSERF